MFTRRFALTVSGSVAAVGLLVGCGQDLPGAAAIVGDQRYQDSELAETTTAITEKLGIPASPSVTQAILSRWVVTHLVGELADRSLVDVTDGQVQQVIAEETEAAGGREALEQGALQSGLLPDQIPEAIRTTLLVEALAEQNSSTDDPSGQTSLLTGVQLLSEELDVRVSPRFGTWNPRELTVGDLPTDLSQPIADDESRQIQAPTVS